MAENKKSFILYCDQKSVIDMLPDEIAGKLFKHIYAYVNDENPTSDELLINLVFEPIKLQLKRDLLKWEGSAETKSINGRLGNLKRWNEDLHSKVIKNEITIEDAEIIAKHRKTSHGDNPQSPPIANIAVNDNVNVTVTDNVKVNDIEQRKLKFASTLEIFLPQYGRETLNKFYGYWTEPNKSNTKFRQELEKTWDLNRRLERWVSNNYNKGQNLSNGQPSKMESMVNSAKEALNMIYDENT
jgi:hypothetical protein